MTDIHNQLKQAPEISLAIRRMFGGDAGLSVERLSETLQPVVNIWEHPECHHLRGERPFSWFVAGPAVAAEQGLVAIDNPTASGWLITIKQVVVSCATAGTPIGAFVVPNTTLVVAGTLTQAATIASTDSRVVLPRIGWSGSDPTAYPIATRLQQLRPGVANESYEMVVATPAILVPGFVYVVQCGTANLAMDVNIAGVLRAAVPGELV